MTGAVHEIVPPRSGLRRPARLLSFRQINYHRWFVAQKPGRYR
jgi:hypothetical protein